MACPGQQKEGGYTGGEALNPSLDRPVHPFRIPFVHDPRNTRLFQHGNQMIRLPADHDANGLDAWFTDGGDHAFDDGGRTERQEGFEGAHPPGIPGRQDDSGEVRAGGHGLRLSPRRARAAIQLGRDADRDLFGRLGPDGKADGAVDPREIVRVNPSRASCSKISPRFRRLPIIPT